MLYLVRHAMPVVAPEASPETWQLGRAGRTAASELVRRLPLGALLVASDEPKAWQTLDPTGDGQAVLRDRRLGEVRRTEIFSEDFRTARRAYVAGDDRLGWEDRTAVAARMEAAFQQHQAAAGDRALVLAGHGMSITLWLASTVGLADPGHFWDSLLFPELLRVDRRTRTMTRGGSSAP